MPRTLTAARRLDLDSPYSGDVELVFLTATHAQLANAIRVVNDAALPKGQPIEYQRGSYNWLGLPFNIILPTDTDQGPPRARIEIPNVDRKVGELFALIDDSPRITLEVIVASQFTRLNPPNEHVWYAAAPSVDYTADWLRLANVQVDAMMCAAEFVGPDLTTEPWPDLRATKGRLPGLYR